MRAPLPSRRRGAISSFAAAAIASLLGGCDDPMFVSEHGSYELDAEELRLELLHRSADGAHLVEQSRMCPVLVGVVDANGNELAVEDGEDLTRCAAYEGNGALQAGEPGCFVASAGAGTLSIAPQACEVDGADAFGPDTLAVDVHAIDDVAVEYDDTTMRWLYRDLQAAPGQTLPPMPTPEADGSWYVVVGERIGIVPQPHGVADPTLRLGFTDGTVRAVGPDAPSLEAGDDGVTRMVPLAGEPFSLALELPAGTLMGAPIIPVDGTTAASLQLLVGWTVCEDEDCETQPLLLQPIVRDAQGHRLHGADVQYELGGTAVIDDEDDLPGDGVVLAELCPDDATGETDVGVSVVARYHGLEASAELDYHCPAGPLSPDLDFDCACRSDAERPGGLVWLLLPTLALRRRRQPAGTNRRSR